MTYKKGVSNMQFVSKMQEVTFESIIKNPVTEEFIKDALGGKTLQMAWRPGTRCTEGSLLISW